jgi:hypothetical protein
MFVDKRLAEVRMVSVSPRIVSPFPWSGMGHQSVRTFRVVRRCRAPDGCQGYITPRSGSEIDSRPDVGYIQFLG